MSLFFFFSETSKLPRTCSSQSKMQEAREHLDSTSTFQVFIYIMSTDTPLAKANHMAKAKDKKIQKYDPSAEVEEEKIYICSNITKSTAANT